MVVSINIQLEVLQQPVIVVLPHLFSLLKATEATNNQQLFQMNYSHRDALINHKIRERRRIKYDGLPIDLMVDEFSLHHTMLELCCDEEPDMKFYRATLIDRHDHKYTEK